MKLEKLVARYFERNIGNISYKVPDKKIKFNDWFMKIDLPIWIDADLECMNTPLADTNQKNFSVSRANAISYNKVESPYYDGDLLLDTDRYIESFGEDWIVLIGV